MLYVIITVKQMDYSEICVSIGEDASASNMHTYGQFSIDTPPTGMFV